MQMSPEELKKLKIFAKNLPVDLGISSCSGSGHINQQQDSQEVNCNQMAATATIEGQKFYNFDQLVEALVRSAGPVRVHHLAHNGYAALRNIMPKEYIYIY
jgi:hypothetical protein